MESPLFQSGRLQNAVVSFPEVYRLGITSVFIRDERAVLSEVPLRSQIQNSIHRCLIEGHIPLAGGALQLADLYLPAADGFSAFSPGNLLHTPLEVDDPVFQVDVTVQQSEGFPCAESGVQHQRIGGRLLVDACSVAPGLESLGLELRDLLRGEDGHRFRGRQVLLALAGHEV